MNYFELYELKYTHHKILGLHEKIGLELDCHILHKKTFQSQFRIDVLEEFLNVHQLIFTSSLKFTQNQSICFHLKSLISQGVKQDQFQAYMSYWHWLASLSLFLIGQSVFLNFVCNNFKIRKGWKWQIRGTDSTKEAYQKHIFMLVYFRKGLHAIFLEWKECLIALSNNTLHESSYLWYYVMCFVYSVVPVGEEILLKRKETILHCKKKTKNS